MTPISEDVKDELLTSWDLFSLTFFFANSIKGAWCPPRRSSSCSSSRGSQIWQISSWLNCQNKILERKHRIKIKTDFFLIRHFRRKILFLIVFVFFSPNFDASAFRLFVLYFHPIRCVFVSHTHTRSHAHTHTHTRSHAHWVRKRERVCGGVRVWMFTMRE